MSETLDTIAERVDRLELAVHQISDQLSHLTNELLPKKPKKFERPKTGAELIAEMAIDKRLIAEGMREFMKQKGIPEKPTIPIEELQKRMAHESGVRPEDNDFSRAIIAEREKES